MKIASAELQMAASHASLQHHEVKESLKVWHGQRRPTFEGESPRPATPATETVTLSDEARKAQADDSRSSLNNDPKLALLLNMIERLTGRKVRVFDAAELQSDKGSATPPAAAAAANPPPAGFGVEYDRHESYTEQEQTTFSASGTVTTADGRQIAFQLELNMQRSYHEESDVSLRLGDAARKTDPLVLNFSGTAAQLSDQRFAFDLNADGSTEQINFAAAGSAFLAFDRNADGVVNNGSELFGPSSGNGFNELAALDGDSNGWIDENDSAFKNLRLWSRNSIGENTLQSLSQAGVGAISLSHIATPFDIKTNANQLLGSIRSTGIFLQEDGSAGTIQQLDLTA